MTGTTQACMFRDEFDDLTATGYSIYGLSNDSPKSNSNFKSKQKLPFTLLCDPAAKLIKAIGMKKTPSGTIRGVFVVDKEGKVEAVSPGASLLLLLFDVSLVPSLTAQSRRLRLPSLSFESLLQPEARLHKMHQKRPEKGRLMTTRGRMTLLLQIMGNQFQRVDPTTRLRSPQKLQTLLRRWMTVQIKAENERFTVSIS